MKTNPTNIMFCGFGGQGIVLSGVILGQAAVYDGLNSAMASSYGSEARGSACRSEVIISTKPIVYPHITKVDIIGAMSQQGYDKFHSRHRDENSLLVFDSSMVEHIDDCGCKQLGVAATETAVKLFDKRIVANIIFLSAIVGLTKIVSQESLEKAIIKYVPSKFKDSNLKAMRQGLSMVRHL